jgi:AraC family transcriptional regulator
MPFVEHGQSTPLCIGNDIASFNINRRYSAAGIDAEIRRYRFDRVMEGPFRPASHFIDFWLHPSPRRSRLLDASYGGLRRPGRVLFLPAGYACQGITDVAEHYSFCLSFQSSFLQDALFQGEGIRLNPCLDVRNTLVHSLMSGLADELTNPGFATDVFFRSAATAIVVQLTRGSDKHFGTATEQTGGDARRAAKVREYIEDNLHGEINLGILAAEVCSSPRHLTRVFKATMGMSVGDYVASSRISRAKALLADPDCPIKTISARCGFSNPRYFATAFRKATGESPGGYRLHARER